MGEAATGVNHQRAPAEVEHEIEALRGRLGALRRSLNRRRREALDLRLQVRRHPLGFGIAAAVIVGATGLSIALAAKRRRKRHPLSTRAKQLGEALLGVLEPAAKRESRYWDKILTAALATAASVLAKRLVERATARAASWGGLPAPS